MKAYLLTWNPKRWTWSLPADLASIARRGFVDHRWSCGHTRRIERGDRVFLLRQGSEPRGIMASGAARSRVYEDSHWERGRRGSANFVDVRLDTLLDPEQDGVLPLARLRSGALREVHWSTQASGIEIPPAAAVALEQAWSAHLAGMRRSLEPAARAGEVTSPVGYSEGATSRVTVNRYERDPRARAACIERYGASCSVCGFDFGSAYGAHGEGFIEVHHLVPLARIGRAYTVDPTKDLRPVCPNCHAMLHRGDRVLAIEELRRLLQALPRRDESKTAPAARKRAKMRATARGA